MRRRSRIMQVVSDFAQRPLDQLHVLDLACLEGGYSMELAKRGSRVTGIEGRRSNLANAETERLRLGLNNLSFVQDDVRNLSKTKYGEFDAVLCLGILYHLDVPDVFELLESVFEVCRDFAIVDTLISEAPLHNVDYQGVSYSGWYYTEYANEPSLEEQEQSSWASIGNQRSFWLTRPSLYNALARVGFTSVYECHNPPVTDLSTDRITLVATKRQKQQLLLTTLEPGADDELWPESREPGLSTTLQLSERGGKWTKTRSLIGRSVRRLRGRD